jgi:hypothetical protein
VKGNNLPQDFVLCPCTGRVLVQPTPTEPPIALQDFARDQHYRQQLDGLTRQEPHAPDAQDPDAYAALAAAGSCSRTY